MSWPLQKRNHERFLKWMLLFNTVKTLNTFLVTGHPKPYSTAKPYFYSLANVDLIIHVSLKELILIIFCLILDQNEKGLTDASAVYEKNTVLAMVNIAWTIRYVKSFKTLIIHSSNTGLASWKNKNSRL